MEPREHIMVLREQSLRETLFKLGKIEMLNWICAAVEWYVLLDQLMVWKADSSVPWFPCDGKGRPTGLCCTQRKVWVVCSATSGKRIFFLLPRGLIEKVVHVSLTHILTTDGLHVWPLCGRRFAAPEWNQIEKGNMLGKGDYWASLF